MTCCYILASPKNTIWCSCHETLPHIYVRAQILFTSAHLTCKLEIELKLSGCVWQPEEPHHTQMLSRSSTYLFLWIGCINKYSLATARNVQQAQQARNVCISITPCRRPEKVKLALSSMNVGRFVSISENEEEEEEPLVGEVDGVLNGYFITDLACFFLGYESRAVIGEFFGHNRLRS